MNLLLGSRPIGERDDKDRVKLNVMQLLHEKYGITEDDFTSAELEAVPTAPACDIGLDRSMIGAYGHDDRVCGYAALRALLDLTETPVKTCVCVLADKEEIGSDGVTGMQSGKKMRLSQPQQMMASEREIIEEAYAGDIIGVFDPGIFSIGDTVTVPGKKFKFFGIPTFEPEHFMCRYQATSMCLKMRN